MFSSFRSTTLSRSFCEAWRSLDRHACIVSVKCRNVTMKKEARRNIYGTLTHGRTYINPRGCTTRWARSRSPNYTYKASECKRTIIRLHCATSKSSLWYMGYVPLGGAFERSRICRTSMYVCMYVLAPKLIWRLVSLYKSAVVFTVHGQLLHTYIHTYILVR